MSKNVFFLLSLCLVIFSCQKDEKTSITMNETEITVSGLGARQTISFDSNMDWAAKSSANWCTLSPANGDASIKSITAILAANDTFDDRSTNVTIMAGGLSKSVTISQGAKLGLIASSDKFDLTNDATTIEVQVPANVEYDVTISDDWITANNTRALSSSKLNFNIAENKTYDNRNASITINQKDGELLKIIKVYQSQEDAIILSSKIENILSGSQTIEVELKTNVDFEVIIPETVKNWVSYAPATRALRTETLLIKIGENKDSDATRSAEVYVKNKATSLQDTLTINQGKAAILPTLTTMDAFEILAYSAKSGGEISSDGGAPILANGVCWATTENPTIENSKTEDEVEGDNFTSKLTDLENTTKYYVRAYATNRVGTKYGTQILFTTVSSVVTPVISPEGGTYVEAQIVTITCATEGAQIRYTLDGTEPEETSALYSGTLTIEEGVTLKAKAFKTDWIESAVATQTYVVKLGAQLIEGTSNTVQHIDASENFIFRLNDLKDKEVFFLFSNNNTSKSTALPIVNSNVKTMKTVKAATAYSESSFVVSGKPSITHFNNNHKMYPKDGMPEPLYQKHLATQPQKLAVGSSELMYDDKGKGQMSTVRKVISAHGKNLYVWVTNDCWGPSSPKKFHVTQQMVDALGPRFLNMGDDNDIYEWVTNAAGEPWGKTPYNNLIPETEDIHIWLTDIDGDNNDATSGSAVTLGYFYARDNFKKSQYKESNEKLMFTIDAVLLGKTTNGRWDVSDYWPMEVISALAHEFTHMIFFYQKEILKQETSTTAINEMCAQCMEDLVANKILANGPRGVPYAKSNSGNGNNPYGRLPLYNSHNDYNILDWSGNEDEVLVNYSKTYALGAYLMRNYGGASLISELVQNSASGAKSIVDAVNANGGNVKDYADVLQRFAAATLLSDNTASDAGYSYNTGGWSTSIINGINYELGSINLYNYSPPPSVYNQLPTTQKPGSNIFYRAGSNLNGTKQWHFEGMSPDTRLTVVIK